jgi:D-alanyl-D-alanine carboxypeptidase
MLSHRLPPAIAIFLACATPAICQSPVTPQAPTSISQKELIGRLEKRVDSLTALDQFSGTILLAKDGQPVFQKAYGYADREAKRRNTIETAFNYSSIGKLFTQAAIWQLISAGKLDADSTLGKYWPDFPNKDVAQTVTIRELLDHRSGVGGDIFDTPAGKTRADVRTMKDYVSLVAGAPMHFPAGTKQEYSNAGYALLGGLIERVSGEDYYSYVTKHVLEPAGLHHTTWYFSTDLPANAAIGYTRSGPDGSEPDPRSPLRRNSNILPGRGSSAGGGYSTVGDLAQFVNALRQASIPGFARVKHGATAGGSPGSNGIIEEELPGGYDIVVLSNFDPPTALQISGAVRNWLMGRPADAPDSRMRIGAGAPPTPASGQPMDLTRTAASRAADRYLHAFNTGDEAVMRAFFEKETVPNPARTTEARLESYRGMHGDLGTLTPLSVSASSETEISIIVHTAKGGQVTMIVTVEPVSPNRIASIRFEAD